MISPKTRKLQGDLLQKIRRNKEFLFKLLLQKSKPMMSDGETCRKKMSENSRNYQKTEVIQIVLRSRFDLVEIGQYFYALPSPNEPVNQTLCREYKLPRDDERTCVKGWIQSNAKIRTRLGHISLQVIRQIRN